MAQPSQPFRVRDEKLKSMGDLLRAKKSGKRHSRKIRRVNEVYDSNDGYESVYAKSYIIQEGYKNLRPNEDTYIGGAATHMRPSTDQYPRLNPVPEFGERETTVPPPRKLD
ncbi:hypothetical protein Trydic_g9983 [Trypoxylus dichotomus]